MKIFKKIFFLTSLIVMVSIFFADDANAQRTVPTEDFTLNFEKIKTWNVARIPNKIPNGQFVLAKHKRTGTKLAAIMRNGKIMMVGTIPARGQFKALVANAQPCLGSGFCLTFQAVHCYTMPWGECVCVCGGFYTTGN